MADRRRRRGDVLRRTAQETPIEMASEIDGGGATAGSGFKLGPAVDYAACNSPFGMFSLMSRRYCLFAVGLMLVISGLCPPSGFSQSDPLPCEVAETEQFDFWLGTWDLTWDEGGHGTNTVERILDGCIIKESFEGAMPFGLYRGISLSAYDPKQKRWRQTWVDNRGGYLEFTGQFEDDRMILQRSTEQNGTSIQQRMVWHSISEDSLDWRWQKSEDGGATWSTIWAIHYTRRK